MEKRLWVCPALCGCELNITADWVTPMVNGKQYQHPASKPTKNTITEIEIVNQCALHAGWETALQDADPYFGAVGYMPIPLNPTPAEFLYLNLYRYTGNLKRLDTCGCRIAGILDKSTGNFVVTKHEIHTKKCLIHANDDDNHTIALDECLTKNETLKQLKEEHPELTDDVFDDEGLLIEKRFKHGTVAWSYNQQRELEIFLPTLTAKQRSDFESKIGKSKVKIK